MASRYFELGGFNKSWAHSVKHRLQIYSKMAGKYNKLSTI
jgi:hypothetical protein